MNIEEHHYRKKNVFWIFQIFIQRILRNMLHLFLYKLHILKKL